MRTLLLSVLLLSGCSGLTYSRGYKVYPVYEVVEAKRIVNINGEDRLESYNKLVIKGWKKYPLIKKAE